MSPYLGQLLHPVNVLKLHCTCLETAQTSTHLIIFRQQCKSGGDDTRNHGTRDSHHACLLHWGSAN